MFARQGKPAKPPKGDKGGKVHVLDLEEGNGALANLLRELVDERLTNVLANLLLPVYLVSHGHEGQPKVLASGSSFPMFV